MILCTNKETGLPAYIWVHEIVRVESHGGPVSYSRVFLNDKRQNHDYFLDVLEDRFEISRRIKHERLELGSEVKNNEQL